MASPPAPPSLQENGGDVLSDADVEEADVDEDDVIVREVLPDDEPQEV
jgi:hypothetical protein